MRILKNISLFALSFLITIIIGINYAKADQTTIPADFYYNSAHNTHFTDINAAIQDSCVFFRAASGYNYTCTQGATSTYSVHIDMTDGQNSSGWDMSIVYFCSLDGVLQGTQCIYTCPSGQTFQNGSCHQQPQCAHTPGESAGSHFFSTTSNTFCDGSCVVSSDPPSDDSYYTSGNCYTTTGNKIISLPATTAGCVFPSHYTGVACTGSDVLATPTPTKPTNQQDCTSSGGQWGTINGQTICTYPAGNPLGTGTPTSTGTTSTQTTSCTGSSCNSSTTNSTTNSYGGSSPSPNLDISSLAKDATLNQIKAQMCGYDDSHPCKTQIDEKDSKKGSDLDQKSQDATTAMDSSNDKFNSLVTQDTAPTTDAGTQNNPLIVNSGGCQNLSIPSFGYIPSMSLDVCQFAPYLQPLVMWMFDILFVIYLVLRFRSITSGVPD